MQKQPKKILIFGATSAIAEETAKLWAPEGCKLFLVARDLTKLKAIQSNLQVLGATSVEIFQKDFAQNNNWHDFLAPLWQKAGGIDVCLVAHGSLGDQSLCEKDAALAEKELQLNFLSIVSILTPLANLLETQGQGTIAVISSVAGDRGRKANYVYASAKAAITVFMQGLRGRLASKNIQVLTIKPGFVDTPMTKHIKKGPLFAQPQSVARDIVASVKYKREVLYTPWFWYWIMFIIRSIPEKLFKHLSI